LVRRTHDITETCERAAAASVFCGLTCALLDLVSKREYPGNQA